MFREKIWNFKLSPSFTRLLARLSLAIYPQANLFCCVQNVKWDDGKYHHVRKKANNSTTAISNSIPHAKSSQWSLSHAMMNKKYLLQCLEKLFCFTWTWRNLTESQAECKAMRWDEMLQRLKERRQHKTSRETQNAVIRQSNLIFNYGILMCLKTLLSFFFSLAIIFCAFDDFRNLNNIFFAMFCVVSLCRSFNDCRVSVEKFSLIGVKKNTAMIGDYFWNEVPEMWLWKSSVFAMLVCLE